jgi:predicted deacylase
MVVELPARGVRIGGTTVAPGEARAVAIHLSPQPQPQAQPRAAARQTGGAAPNGAARSIPAWVAVGAKAGPRVSVVAALRGVESDAAAAATALAAALDPAALAGSVVIVPVLRPGGRFATGAHATARWRFPGDAGGARRARDAFTVFSEVAVGANALVILGAPPHGRRGAVVARGQIEDPRVRRLALQSGALAALATDPPPWSLLGAAGAAGIAALELRAASRPGDATPAAAALAAAVRALLGALDVSPAAERAERPLLRAQPVAPLIADTTVRVRAPVGGILEAALAPATFVRAGAVLARVAPVLPGQSVVLTAPADALVLETPPAGAVRAGAPLFLLAPAVRPAARGRSAASALAAGPSGGGAAAAEAKLRVGWVEHVTLPDLAIARLKAKIDTGARTSALHVARMRTVDMAGGPQRRPILEITVPGGGRGKKPQRVRAAVREYVVVRDTSGRMERRPVIETALQLGPIRRRISVTLTNRGDMLFPMLIGRTALGTGVVVDPVRRYLLK